LVRKNKNQEPEELSGSLLSAVATAFIVAILFLSCGKDNNLLAPEPEPQVVVSPLEYFSLSEGSRWKYMFSDHYKENKTVTGGSYQELTHNYDGYFTLTVIKTLEYTLEEGRSDFYKLLASFIIEKEEFSHIKGDTGNNGGAAGDSSYTRNVYVESSVYSLLLVNDTLWYIENAPSFNILDQGERSPMMLFSDESGAIINPRLFNYPEADYFSTIKGGTRQQKIYTFQSPDNAVLVQMEMDKGFILLHNISSSGDSQDRWERTIIFELIEE